MMHITNKKTLNNKTQKNSFCLQNNSFIYHFSYLLLANFKTFWLQQKVIWCNSSSQSSFDILYCGIKAVDASLYSLKFFLYINHCSPKSTILMHDHKVNYRQSIILAILYCCSNVKKFLFPQRNQKTQLHKYSDVSDTGCMKLNSLALHNFLNGLGWKLVLHQVWVRV